MRKVIDQAFDSFGAIRHRQLPEAGWRFSNITVRNGAVWRPFGGITPTDGNAGGWLYMRSPDSFAEFRLFTTRDQTGVIWGGRTGPTNWIRYYITSGINISVNWVARATLGYDQVSGLAVPVEPEPAIEWFFIPGDESPTFKSYPFSIGPDSPFLDYTQSQPFIRLGYAPGLCRALYVEKIQDDNAISIEIGREYVLYAQTRFNHRASFYADTWDSFAVLNPSATTVLFRWANTPISLEVRT